MINVIIRNIKKEDLYEVECVAKKAFWNLNMPGCDEHYTIHRLWKNDAYIPELSMLAENDGKIIGAILYAKATIQTSSTELETLTFAPLCVDPCFQKQGIGKHLLKKSMEKARTLGFGSILIYGVPTYYPKYGFGTADKFGIQTPNGTNFDAFMGIELIKGSLSGVNGKFYEPSVYCVDVHDANYIAEVDRFDKAFPYMEKKILPRQWR
ncbi:MAG: N-acetyltransferase [Clostridiales bacterium]|nr:N-acetyltransferase [Clostridiales bacterium]